MTMEEQFLTRALKREKLLTKDRIVSWGTSMMQRKTG